VTYFYPFSKDPGASQSGNVLLIMGIIATTTAIIGGKVMLDQVTGQRKAALMAEQNKRAKEIPGSAAMIAKALISLPPHVTANKLQEWSTSKLIVTPANMPFIYPIPYVAGTIGGVAQSAMTVAQTSAPPAGANWDLPTATYTATVPNGMLFSADVNVYANDSTRATPQNIGSALVQPSAVVNGGATIKRTKSIVTYTFRNCDRNGASSATFTGLYCAMATIKSDNYAAPFKGNDTLAASSNKGMAQLGLIEPPPSPICGAISMVGPQKIKYGESFSLAVRATGVALGYTVNYGGTSLKNSGTMPLHLPWDHPTQEATYTISDIPATGSALAEKFNDPCIFSINFDVVLTGVNGTSATCPVSVEIDRNLVSCVSNSFNVERLGQDLRTCKLDLSKDSGNGRITSVSITETNSVSGSSINRSFASPAFNPAGQWSFSTWSCKEDALVFDASLYRSTTCPTPSVSKCQPKFIVPELDPKCATFNYSRTKNSTTQCTIEVNRDPASHSKVQVAINDVVQPTAWVGNQWKVTNYPCGSGTSSIRASLVRGSKVAACGAAQELPQFEMCVADSVRVARLQNNLSKCQMTLSKDSAATTALIKFVNKDGSAVTNGTWSGNVWTSPQFDCDFNDHTYTGSITGTDNTVSRCGVATIDKITPLCSNFRVVRTAGESCAVSLSKNSDAGLNTPVSIKRASSPTISSSGTWSSSLWSGRSTCSGSGDTISGSFAVGGINFDCGSVYIPPYYVCNANGLNSTATFFSEAHRNPSYPDTRNNGWAVGDVFQTQSYYFKLNEIKGDIFKLNDAKLDDYAFIVKPGDTFPVNGLTINLPDHAMLLYGGQTLTGWTNVGTWITFKYKGKTVSVNGDNNNISTTVGAITRGLGIPTLAFDGIKISDLRNWGFEDDNGNIAFKFVHVASGAGYVYAQYVIAPCR
jgi:hypothetical protein